MTPAEQTKATLVSGQLKILEHFRSKNTEEGGLRCDETRDGREQVVTTMNTQVDYNEARAPNSWPAFQQNDQKSSMLTKLDDLEFFFFLNNLIASSLTNFRFVS